MQKLKSSQKIFSLRREATKEKRYLGYSQLFRKSFFADKATGFQINLLRKFSGMLLIFFLAACISGVKQPDTYTNSSGQTTVIETGSEACVRACNDIYARCNETQAARSVGVNGYSGIFGASGECRSDLKMCLPDCRKR
jgi:hypothetical protein